MNHRLEQRLNRLIAAGHAPLLAGGRIGLEKEGLRMGPDGLIAQTSHPNTLGSALTHPFITTDYSEALLEFITPPDTDSAVALRFLHDLHAFAYRNLGDELIWAASMPCVVDGEQSIRIAEYGRSNQGRLKHVYRLGLGHRYGKVMQVIAGIHFNYSLADAFWPVYQQLEEDGRPLQAFIDDAYFGLIRNVHRYNWLLLYLFGASPAICKSFMRGREHTLQEYDANTWYAPLATSLRMSDIGYSNRRRCRLKVTHDSLSAYIDSLRRALHTPCPPFADMGVEVGGEYRQLTTNVLQIENEYYSTIRPKQPPLAGERPLLAMQRRGVSYVELRSSDINVFDPVGLDLAQARFLEAFLLFCLLEDSPPISEREQRVIDRNQLLTAREGRKPGLMLVQANDELPLRDWGLTLCECMRGLCEQLDQVRRTSDYSRSLMSQMDALYDPECTPSARVLAAMRSEGSGFYHFAAARSRQYRQQLLDTPLSAVREHELHELTKQSLADQQALEAADDASFADYLTSYLAQI